MITPQYTSLFPLFRNGNYTCFLLFFQFQHLNLIQNRITKIDKIDKIDFFFLSLTYLLQLHAAFHIVVHFKNILRLVFTIFCFSFNKTVVNYFLSWLIYYHYFVKIKVFSDNISFGVISWINKSNNTKTK